MKRKSCIVVVMILILTTVMSMAGCGKKDTEQKTETNTQQDAKEEQSTQNTDKQDNNTDSEEKVTLRFMWWGGDARHEATLKVIEQYEKLHPNVHIEAEYSGYDGYFEKIATQISGNTAADIIQFDASMTTDLLAMGDVFADLSQYGEQLDLSDFDQNFLNSFSYYNEKLVGLPTGVNAGIWLMNTQLLEDAGIQIDEIKTWDDLIQAGEKLHAANSDQYLFNIDITTLGKEIIYTMIAQLTGKELIDDQTNSLNFTNEELKQVFTVISDLYDKGVVEPAADSAPYDTQVNTNPKWISHDLASTYTATSNINGAYYDFNDTAVAMNMPEFENAKESGILFRPAQLIGVSSNCAHPEVAADFLNYFYNNEEAIKTLKDCRSIPATSNGRKICEENGFLDPVLVEAVEKAQNTATGNQNLSVPTEVVEILKDATEKIAYKQASIDDITAETISLIEDTLERLQR